MLAAFPEKVFQLFSTTVNWVTLDFSCEWSVFTNILFSGGDDIGRPTPNVIWEVNNTAPPIHMEADMGPFKRDNAQHRAPDVRFHVNWWEDNIDCASQKGSFSIAAGFPSWVCTRGLLGAPWKAARAECRLSTCRRPQTFFFHRNGGGRARQWSWGEVGVSSEVHILYILSGPHCHENPPEKWSLLKESGQPRPSVRFQVWTEETLVDSIHNDDLYEGYCRGCDWFKPAHSRLQSCPRVKALP